MLLFVGDTLRTMKAVGAVPRAPRLGRDRSPPTARTRPVAARVAAQPGVARASATATGPFAGAVAPAVRRGRRRPGRAALPALPADYLRHLSLFRDLQGALAPGQVVLDQQMAATLRAATSATPCSCGPPRWARPPGQGERRGHRQLAGHPFPAAEPPSSARRRPSRRPTSRSCRSPPSPAPTRRTLHPITPASVGTSAEPGAGRSRPGTLQAQLDRPGLARAPARREPMTCANQTKEIRVERSLPGQIQFVDNLSDRLNTAAVDALYAQIRFYIMLAVPGALIALGLAYLAALGSVERDRRNLALLRARGATRRDLLGLAGSDPSLVIGMIAGLAGAGLAVPRRRAADRRVGRARPRRRAATVVVVCVAARRSPAASPRGSALGCERCSETVERRQRVAPRSGRVPLWQRLYLDLPRACGQRSHLLAYRADRLLGSGQPGLEPDLVALDLHVLRARTALARRNAAPPPLRSRPGARLTFLIGRKPSRRATTIPRAFLLASASRRGTGHQPRPGARRPAARLRRQPRHLRRHLRPAGAASTPSSPSAPTSPPRRRRASPPSNGLAKRIAARAGGLRPTSAVDHSYAYVGPDLQDTFGIDTGDDRRARRRCATPTSSAAAPQTMLSRLQRTPRRDPRLQGDDHRLLAQARRPAQAARARPSHRPASTSCPSTSSASSRSSPRRRGTRSWSPTSPTCRRPITPAGPTSSSPAPPKTRPPSPAGSPTATTGSTARRQGHPPADGADRQLDHHRRPDRDQPASRRRSRSSSRRRRCALFVDLVVSERRHEFATMAALGASLRDIGAFVRSEAVAGPGAGLALGRGPRLAAGADADRDASARLRSAARSPRDPVGIPRAVGRRRRSRRSARCRPGRALPAGLLLGGILREE